MANELFDLDTPLIEFKAEGGISTWTIRDAVEGVQIFGGIGSGKTSGSGRMLALKYLKNGFGGLVLTAKADEKDMWIEYCKQANRLHDLIIVEPGGKYHFNFLEYESSQKIGDTSITENIVQVLKTVIQSSEEKSSGKSDDPFWESALDMLIFNVIDLCLIAFGKISVRQMYDIVLSAPKKEKSNVAHIKPGSYDDVFKIAVQNVKKKIDDFTNRLTTEEKEKLEDPELFNKAITDNIPQAGILKFVDQFFIENYRMLSEKTRSIIEFSFTGFLFRLMKEPVFSLFCRHPSNFTPEDSLNGKIILLNLPVKKYHKVGRDSQILFKYIWQRVMEKRQIDQNGRPVFLWADESQNFLHEYDAEYQATARSSRIATVYISQNLPNYHANMGGNKSEYKVKSFLGTLGTKIFHANADIETNKYASELIGDAWLRDESTTETHGEKPSRSINITSKLEKMVRPEEFGRLRTGSPINDFKVDGYMCRQGKPFHDGKNHRKVSFKQNND